MNDAAIISSATEANCDWPVTNCYIDVWRLILEAWGLDHRAALGITVTQDYEGDQFTFFKYRHEDLERLYGILVGELTIWDSLEAQLVTQVRLGRLSLAEVDGFYLPDTRATSYRTQHTKTTIGVDAIDPAAGRFSYYHNLGHYTLDGEDYAGIFRRLPAQAQADDVLPPYVEFVKRTGQPLRDAALTEAAMDLLRSHLRRLPATPPIRAWRANFRAQMEWLMAHPERFHDYAFGVFRQLGANHQLLAEHLAWLGARGVAGLGAARDAAANISAAVKAMQFKVARIASRRRFDPCDASFDALERDQAAMIETITAALH